MSLIIEALAKLTCLSSPRRRGPRCEATLVGSRLRGNDIFGVLQVHPLSLLDLILALKARMIATPNTIHHGSIGDVLQPLES